MSGISFFRETAQCSETLARTGELTFKRTGRDGSAEYYTLETPVFMPVGTLGSVKGLWQEDLEEIGYRLILANTYHTWLRPGEKIIKEFNGLKNMMTWDGALLTDSGGYQVFSLSERTRFHENGVEFQSHIDGSRHLFTPGSVIDFQTALGSDIMMVLDDCPPADGDPVRIQKSLERTHRWAAAAADHYNLLKEKGMIDPERQRIFGIIQGGLDPEKRKQSAEWIQSLPFSGIAVGGLSVGESREELYSMLDYLGPLLGKERPRYLMGVGTIPDFLEAVKNGIDMFDCVLPTRNARNAQALTSQGKLNLRNAVHAADHSPLDPECSCRVCRRYSRGYIRHLFISGEMLGPQLVTYHNLAFFYSFMSEMRKSVKEGRFGSFYTHWRSVKF